MDIAFQMGQILWDEILSHSMRYGMYVKNKIRDISVIHQLDDSSTLAAPEVAVMPKDG